MNELRQAAQQALKYMKSVGQADMYPEEWAIVGRLEAALAQQAEPGKSCRAWMDPASGDVISDARHEAWERDFGLAGKGKAALFTVPLYTTPPKRLPLTDEDILRVLMLDPPNPSLWPHLKGEAIVGDVQQAVLAIVRAVERALEEQNRGR